jgi:phage protein D
LNWITHKGFASLSLTLALGQPALAPQTPVRVRGFKPGIDGVGWLVVRVTHDINDQGFTTKIDCELNALANDLSETDEDFGVVDVVDSAD